MSPQTCCAEVDAGVAACASSCPSNDTIGCMAPSQCGGSTPECCGSAVLNGGSIPNCNVSALSSKCVATCTSNIGLSCGSPSNPVTDTLHMCAKTADCANDTQNPNCCLVHGYYVCVSNLDKTFGGLTCL